jgi:hypothetical protein
MLARNLVLKWEAKLRREGLAPIDQRIGNRVVVRTEIITPQALYLPEPERLARAIEAWLGGDHSHFSPAGLALMARDRGRGAAGPGKWARRRARRLLRICAAHAEGRSIGQALGRYANGRTYSRLRELAGCLVVEAAALGDDGDDHGGGDGRNDA